MSEILTKNRYNFLNARGVGDFPYFVGISSLAEIATRADKVCVINILGGESRAVTPTSHVYSGGNVVCGTMPGRSGEVLKTDIGDIPVYNNVLEAMKAGHRFNAAVIYVPPSGVKDSVIEAVRVNPDLRKVFIVTEKVPVRDARIIRQYCQMAGVDVFGANSLGVADAHNRVRIGGALGGSNPTEALTPGSVAVFSNSGNFTTTISVYLPTAGWGVTTAISSGKDLFIHYAAPEFAYAFEHDERSKAAVLYVEPGGYYERDISCSKPVVACVVGHWKAKLTRSVGHAGAITGSGDRAADKERWFMEKFGVDAIYTPENPICSAKGAVVDNISYVPQALTAVMKLNGVEPDFEPKGDLSLKCWFANDQGIALPPQLQTPVVEAVAPYNQAIAAVNKQVGVVFPRQTMKDASGASRMDAKTQITSVHGVSVLEAATHAFEENLAMALTREYPDENGIALSNVILNAYVNQWDTPQLRAAEASRQAGNSPNTALAAAVAILGPKSTAADRQAARTLTDLFAHSGLKDPGDLTFDFGPQLASAAADASIVTALTSRTPSARGQAMLGAMQSRGATSIFLRFLTALADKTGGHASEHAILAAVTTHLAWKALMRKRISLLTVGNLPWHYRIYSALVGASVVADKQEEGRFCGVSEAELMRDWRFSATAYLAIFGKAPNENELFAWSLLLGLIISNGPGTISAQGAKGAVSADGPEDPDRVQINKAYAGFLTHTGYAHGGNGFEAIQFLHERFQETNLDDPSRRDHGLNLEQMASAYAHVYKAYKIKAKAEGNLAYKKIPCVNHPVFKGKDVNYDPREVFAAKLFEERGEYNVFLDYYHQLVQALFDAGVSKNVYCVNIDAVIAVILLKILWKPFRAGRFSQGAMESAAFTAFLYGRMNGVAAEIEDHSNRGRNMDTRTRASQTRYVG